jgi:serine/threonine-protein kinase
MELSDRGDLKTDNLIVWEKTIRELFPMAIPNNCQWEDMESIISVLNKISSVDSLAHTLFPVGGGHDIIRVERSTEKETIELRTPHSVRIVKPKVLEFNYFPNHIDWAYFRLETGGLKPITPNLDLSLIKEKLTELEPGHFVEKEIWEKGYLGYDKNGYRILLPKSARKISRYFKGSFVIFAQNSLYNKNHVTYDARHDRMNSKKFRQYIEKSILNLSSNS